MTATNSANTVRSFRSFLEAEAQEEEDRDILRTLGKIPPSHAKLVQGYTFTLQGGNTLKDDDDHVGYVQDDPKKIVVAAPWNYGREFTVLHEVGHRVYDQLPAPIKQRWAQLAARTPNTTEKDPEELFCMAYANHYAKHRVVTHEHPEWHRFIAGLPR